MTDWRLEDNRREAFQRFYTHHLRHKTHPGLVYLTLPYVADRLNWDEETRYWAAWVQTNTQNIVTTLLLLEHAPRMQDWKKASNYLADHWALLQWDSDRKWQKGMFGKASGQYCEIMESAGSQAAYWKGCRAWGDCWAAMQALPHIGRLSGWSGLEFHRLLTDAPIPDADTLLLKDKNGSRSHRNGLCLLAGHDDMVQDRQLNPDGYLNEWEPAFLNELKTFGDDLLVEARSRNQGHPDVTRLTLESALCTWKSWHKRNRRYPNCYADMLHSRITWAEARHGHKFGVLWDARRALPGHLRLEDSPNDPGMVPLKQNWYRETGEQVLLGYEWPDMWSGFDQGVQDGKFGTFR